MVDQIYSTELQLHKTNSFDIETPFLDLDLSIINDIVSSRIYDKQDYFNFEIVNFPLLDGDFSRTPSYGVYILLSMFVLRHLCSNIHDFTTETNLRLLSY